MANIPRRRLTNFGPPPPSRFSPFKELGTAGVAVFGGRVMSTERGVAVTGNQRWITYGEMVANTSIVAAGVRYFLNIVAGAKWTVKPNEQSKDKEASDFVDSVLNGMTTPWRRVARRSSSYRFMGFGIQEWTAKRRKQDQKIVLDDIEARPQHTIQRWEVDPKGSVLGVWQASPQTGEWIYLPRAKLMYLVEDSLTDSPEGLGLYRHLVDPYLRLQKYLLLEGQGFERDLRGIPVGRVPYQAIEASVKAGVITKDAGQKLTRAIEDFVKMQTKTEDTSIVLDSVPYVVENESGKTISSVMQYGLELLQGQGADFNGLNQAIVRLNHDMARVIGAEHLLLGGGSGSAGGGANRALAEDKSRNFYQVVNGTLDDIVDQANVDVIPRICDLNGIPEERYPKLAHSDISFRSVSEVTAALRDMALAGAVLQPNDPAINDVRDMLGIEQAPKMTAAMMGAMGGTMGPGGVPLPPAGGGGDEPPAPKKPRSGPSNVASARGAKGSKTKS